MAALTKAQRIIAAIGVTAFDHEAILRRTIVASLTCYLYALTFLFRA
jgi:hypothetical protein